MQLNKFFQVSAIAAALALAGCGGDININEGSVDNSVTDSNNSTVNPPPTNPDPTDPDPTDPTDPTEPTDPAPGTDVGQNPPDGWPTSAIQQELAVDVSADYPEIQGKPVYRLPEGVTFTADVTLTNDVHWVLNGRTGVGNDNADSATLWIEAGTTIIGTIGDDFLVARRGSKIHAMGTAEAPITMTSIQDMTGQPTGIGQWGGLVLLGNAPHNRCDGDGDLTTTDEELASCGENAEGDAGPYGGNNPEDNSGILNYLVLKHAGMELGTGNELNGISFAGVGSGTEVDYIQVHQNLDDGIEFFGGTVNVKHVVLTGNGDDSLDWAFGWTGRAQHVYIQHSDDFAHRGFESDNHEDFRFLTPVSNPMLSNITIVGSTFDGEDDSEGVLLRHGTHGRIHNLFVTGPEGMGECFEVDSLDDTQAAAQEGNLVVTHSVIACNNGENFKGDIGAQSVEEWFLAQDGNMAYDGSAAIELGFGGYAPMAGSPLLQNGIDPSTVDPWFDSTDYIGAFDGVNDWTAGWTVGVNPTFPTNVQNAFEQGLATEIQVAGITDKPVYRLAEETVFKGDVTLTNDAHWVLSGRTAVGEDNSESGTLWIQEGTTIIGTVGDDFLVVRRGSKIQALGSANAPITMTSMQDVTGEPTAIGQWGGVVLLGNAPHNRCDANGDLTTTDEELATCGENAEGDAGQYGGNDPHDNSGTLRYFVVKHAGMELGTGNELNGISFAGVGDGTRLEYIHVHQNLDDGIEFFGGTVNIRNVVLTEIGDDSLDWAFGWTGRAQFVAIKHSDDFAHRGFESDNHEDFRFLTPVSNPMVSNVTIIGSTYDGEDDSEGVLLRHGTYGRIHNMAITGPEGMGECFEIDSLDDTQAAAQEGNLVVTHSVVACDNGENFKGNVGTQTVEEWFLSQTGNFAFPTSAELGLDNYMPTADSPLLGAGIDASTVDSWFKSTNYIGAFDGTNDWTNGWVTVGLND